MLSDPAELIEIQVIPAAYNKYFTKLATDTPEALIAPDVPTAQELGAWMTRALPDDFDIAVTDINEVFDAGKVGFAYIKLFSEIPGKRFSGTKYINTVPTTDDPEND